MPIDHAKVSIDDRGYQYGDGVYEVISICRQKPFLFAEHIRRLRRSLDGLKINFSDMEEVAAVVKTLCRQYDGERAKLYLSVTRGVAPRSHAFPSDAKPSFVATIRQAPKIPEEFLTKGVKAITLPDYRWGRCDLKTLNLLWNVMAAQQAAEKGAKEAILLDENGIVREGTTSNLFVISSKKMLTHPLTRNILPGITRGLILELAEKMGIETSEEFFSVNRLMEADEIFISGTIAEIAGITQVDGQKISGGLTGPLTKKLREALWESIEKYCAKSDGEIYDL